LAREQIRLDACWSGEWTRWITECHNDMNVSSSDWMRWKDGNGIDDDSRQCSMV
jgi:hypothetical protein